jgi:hypothetical protein
LVSNQPFNEEIEWDACYYYIEFFGLVDPDNLGSFSIRPFLGNVARESASSSISRRLPRHVAATCRSSSSPPPNIRFLLHISDSVVIPKTQATMAATRIASAHLRIAQSGTDVLFELGPTIAGVLAALFGLPGWNCSM